MQCYARGKALAKMGLVEKSLLFGGFSLLSGVSSRPPLFYLELMCATILKQSETVSYTGMCVAKSVTQGWTKPTLLLRLCEEFVGDR